MRSKQNLSAEYPSSVRRKIAGRRPSAFRKPKSWFRNAHDVNTTLIVVISLFASILFGALSFAALFSEAWFGINFHDTTRDAFRQVFLAQSAWLTVVSTIVAYYFVRKSSRQGDAVPTANSNDVDKSNKDDPDPPSGGLATSLRRGPKPAPNGLLARPQFLRVDEPRHPIDDILDSDEPQLYFLCLNRLTRPSCAMRATDVSSEIEETKMADRGSDDGKCDLTKRLQGIPCARSSAIGHLRWIVGLLCTGWLAIVFSRLRGLSATWRLRLVKWWKHRAFASSILRATRSGD